MVYLVNLSERDYQRKKNKWLPKIFEWVKVRPRSSSIVWWQLGLHVFEWAKARCFPERGQAARRMGAAHFKSGPRCALV